MPRLAPLVLLLLVVCLPSLALAGGPQPFFTLPVSLPGRLQAENYDQGGEGVAYHDTDAANTGNAYRVLEGVDLQPCSEGTFDVGWFHPGEWMLYTVNVSRTANYDIVLRVASPAAGGDVALQLGDQALGQVAIPNTGAWQTYQTVSLATNVPLTAGLQQLRVSAVSNQAASIGNLNWIDFTLSGVAPPALPEVPAAWDPAFTDQLFTDGLTAPTDVAFAPDGRIFISEKQGTIRIWKNGALLPTPFIDLIAEVHNAGDKGLLSIALHPLFLSNNYIYLLYAVDPIYGQPDEGDFTPVMHRLVRYAANGDVADPASRTILIGNSPADGLVSCGNTHTAGKMRFAPDTSLMFTFGEGGHYEYVDLGNDAKCIAAGMITPPLDVGAYRAQNLNTLLGKVLRIDPDTGLGLPTNPWYDPAQPIQSRIWALGLRNPFRWSFKPTTDGSIVLLLANVGNGDYEHMAEVRQGDNMLWPCYEGPLPAPGYYAARPAYCANVAGLVGNQNWPFLWFDHLDSTLSVPPGVFGNALTGAVAYTGTNYPAAYQNAVFLCDYARGWVRVAWVDYDNRAFVGTLAANANAPSSVTVEVSPPVYGGDIFYLNLNAGQLRRITYGHAVPEAYAAAFPASGLVPLTVSFSSDGSHDPLHRPLALLWDFGDGSFSTEPNPTHTFTTSDDFTVRFALQTRSGANDQSASATVVVSTRTVSPVVHIVKPTSHVYNPGDNVTFGADTTGSPPGTALSWELQLVHEGHYHPQTDLSVLPTPSFPLEAALGSDGQRYSYRIVARATSPLGFVVSDRVSMVPTGEPSRPPLASFLVTAAAGVAPLQVGFDASGSADPDGDYLEYAWQWGDGTPSSSGSSNYHLFGPGTFTVTLTASDNFGLSSTATRTLVVTAPAATSTPATLPPAPPETSLTPPPGTTEAVVQTTAPVLSGSPSPTAAPPPATPNTTQPPSTTYVVPDYLRTVPFKVIGNASISGDLHAAVTLPQPATLLIVSGALSISSGSHLYLTLLTEPAADAVTVVDFAQASLIEGKFASVTLVPDYTGSECDSIAAQQHSSTTRLSILLQTTRICTPNGSSSLAGWAIALIVLGVIAAIVVAALLVWLFLRLKRTKPQKHKDIAASPSNSSGAGSTAV